LTILTIRDAVSCRKWINMNHEKNWPDRAMKAMRQRRAAKVTPMMSWLRGRTFADVYGSERLVEGRRETRPSYCKLSYQSKRNSRRRVRRMANFDYRDHFDQQATHYFMGCPKAASTLVMIDIDVLKKLALGTTEGAWKYAEHLKTIWPDLYFESSTGGKGVHGYLVVEKCGQDAAAVNAFLKRLQDWLRAEASATNADIELVEVKGTLPDIRFAGTAITALKYGQFAKIPRNEGRFEELKGTTVLDIDRPLPPNSGHVVPSAKIVKNARFGTASCGSTTGRNVTEEEVARVPEYERLYQALGLELRHARYVVNANDFAVFCVLTRFFKANGNLDGTLPVRRVAAFWNELHACGQADRPFNFRRYKAIQDYLSRNKHVLWEDHRYQRPEGEQQGVACKWGLTDHFFGLLDLAAGQGGASFVVTEEFKRGTGEHRTPTPWLVRVEKEKKWWAWATERLENYEDYSLAA